MFSYPQIIQWLAVYKYFVLFPIVVIEGPIITIISGFLASVGKMNFFLAYAVIAIGDVAGDSIYYAMGYWGRKKFIERWGHYIGITFARVEKLEKHFTQHGGKTLMLGKISHGIGGVFLAAAGVARMPFRKFLWYNFIATLPKSLALMLVGYYFGFAYERMNSYLSWIGFFIAAIAIFAIIFYLMPRTYEE